MAHYLISSLSTTDSSFFRDYYSIIAQSMLALFAVVGMFVVYRLQQIYLQINSSYIAFKAFVERYYTNEKTALIRLKKKLNGDFLMWLDKDVLFHLEKALRIEINDEANSLARDNPPINQRLIFALMDYYSEIANLKQRKGFLEGWIAPILVSIFLIFIWAVGTILNIGSFSLDYLFNNAISIFIVACVLFLSCIFYMWKTIQDPQIEMINNPFVNRYQDLREILIQDKIKKINGVLNESERKLKKKVEKFYKRYHSTLIPVKTFFNRYDAEQARGLLDEQKIKSFVQADDCGGVYLGMSLGAGNVRLLISPSDLKKAKETLKVLED